MATTFVFYFLIRLKQKFKSIQNVGDAIYKKFEFCESTFVLATDSVGLAVHTIIGVMVAIEVQATPLWLLGSFIALLTSVGGGIVRDAYLGQRLSRDFMYETTVFWSWLLTLYIVHHTLTLTASEMYYLIAATCIGILVSRYIAIKNKYEVRTFWLTARGGVKMAENSNIDNDKIRNVLSFLQESSNRALSGKGPLTKDKIETFLKAVENSHSTTPLFKFIDEESYKSWWMSHIKEQSNFTENIDKAWQQHHTLITSDDNQTKKALFSFATKATQLDIADPNLIRGRIMDVLVTISTSVSILANSLLLANSHTALPDKSNHLHNAKMGAKVINKLTDTCQQLAKGEYADASLSMSSSIVTLSHLSLSLSHAAQKARSFMNISAKTMLPAAGRILPFVGLGLSTAGAVINEVHIHRQKKKIAETETKLVMLESEINQPSSNKKQINQDILTNKHELIDMEAELKGRQLSRASNSIYTAMAVSSIVLAATAASVMTAGILPAALAVGVGAISLGMMAAEKFASKKISDKAFKAKLVESFDNIQNKVALLPEGSLLSLNKKNDNDPDALSFNEYIEMLIEKNSKEADKVLAQFDKVVEAHMAVDIVDPGDEVVLLLAKERESLEISSMKLLLSEVETQPTAKVSAEQLFDEMQIKHPSDIQTTPSRDLEQRLVKIESEIQDLSDHLNIDLTDKLSIDGQRSRSIMDYIDSLIMIKPDVAEPLIYSMEEIVQIKQNIDRTPRNNTFLRMYHQKALEQAVGGFTSALETSQKLLGGLDNSAASIVDKAMELVDVTNTVPTQERESVIDAFIVREAEIARPDLSEFLANVSEETFDHEITSRMTL